MEENTCWGTAIPLARAMEKFERWANPLPISSLTTSSLRWWGWALFLLMSSFIAESPCFSLMFIISFKEIKLRTMNSSIIKLSIIITFLWPSCDTNVSLVNIFTWHDVILDSVIYTHVYLEWVNEFRSLNRHIRQNYTATVRCWHNMTVSRHFWQTVRSSLFTKTYWLAIQLCRVAGKWVQKKCQLWELSGQLGALKTRLHQLRMRQSQSVHENDNVKD